MPFYYDTVRATNTNGTPLTESEIMRFLSIANQESSKISGVYGTARSGTAGGASLRLKTFGTAGSGGTAQTPAKRNPNNPATALTAFNDATALTGGTTPTVRIAVGMAQTGGNGGWVAWEPDAAIKLLPNGGANGNAELYSIANLATVAIDASVETNDGA